jgi:hypothetical protein
MFVSKKPCFRHNHASQATTKKKKGKIVRFFFFCHREAVTVRARALALPMTTTKQIHVVLCIAS